MESVELIHYRDEFYPSGGRKVFALMLVIGVTLLPETISWTQAPSESTTARSMPTGRFRPRGGFLPDQEDPRPDFLSRVWAVFKRSVIVIATTLGVMIYYPRAGFKRYSLLCGPVIAFFVPFCIRQYLQGRSEVYRAEILIVMLLALLPGAALYVFLTWRKARRLGMVW